MAIIEDDIPLVEVQDRVLERVWWHASTSSSLDLTRTREMHWGSMEAATERAYFSLSPLTSNRLPVYLYQTSLRAGLRVHSDVLVERPGEPTNHDHAKKLLATHDVVRYINGTEGPGAVSLMLFPPALDTVICEGVLSMNDGIVTLSSP